MRSWRSLEDVDFNEVLSVLKPLRGRTFSKVKIASYMFHKTPCLYSTSLDVLKMLIELGVLTKENGFPDSGFVQVEIR